MCWKNLTIHIPPPLCRGKELCWDLIDRRMSKVQEAARVSYLQPLTASKLLLEVIVQVGSTLSSQATELGTVDGLD